MEPVIEPQPALTSSEEEQAEDVEYTAQEIEELPRRCTCKNLYHSSFAQCMLRAEQDSPFCASCYSDDCNCDCFGCRPDNCRKGRIPPGRTCCCSACIIEQESANPEDTSIANQCWCIGHHCSSGRLGTQLQEILGFAKSASPLTELGGAVVVATMVGQEHAEGTSIEVVPAFVVLRIVVERFAQWVGPWDESVIAGFAKTIDEPVFHRGDVLVRLPLEELFQRVH